MGHRVRHPGHHRTHREMFRQDGRGPHQHPILPPGPAGETPRGAPLRRLGREEPLMPIWWGMTKLQIPYATLDRFWAKVRVTRTGCWAWAGTHNKAGGTRRKHWRGNSVRPRFRLHRGNLAGPTHVYVAPFILSLSDGVPLDQREGKQACHLGVCPDDAGKHGCHAWCINPAHLYWGTADDN